MAENADLVTNFVEKSLDRLGVDKFHSDLADVTALVASVFSLSVREVEILCSELAVIFRREPKAHPCWLLMPTLLCVIRWRERDFFDVLRAIQPSNAIEAGALCRQRLHHRFMPFLEEHRSYPYRLLIAICFRKDQDALAKLIPDSYTLLDDVNKFRIRRPNIERAVATLCRRVAQP